MGGATETEAKPAELIEQSNKKVSDLLTEAVGRLHSGVNMPLGGDGNILAPVVMISATSR